MAYTSVTILPQKDIFKRQIMTKRQVIINEYNTAMATAKYLHFLHPCHFSLHHLMDPTKKKYNVDVTWENNVKEFLSTLPEGLNCKYAMDHS